MGIDTVHFYFELAVTASVEDTMTDDSYFNISEIKLSITSLYIFNLIPLSMTLFGLKTAM